MNSNVKSQIKQNGAATLFVAVVILIIMTLMVVYAARVGLFEQRISANDVRYKEAFAIADGGLDFSTQLFASEFALLYDGTDASTAASTLATIVTNSSVNNQSLGSGSFSVTAANTGAVLGSIPIYTFSSVGTGADGTGTATVERQITMSYVFGGTVPDVPVIVGGAVGTGGNFNVVANSDAAGDGVPVSVWASGDIEATGSSATCHDEFYDGNNAQCSNPSGNDENITTGDGSNLTTYDANYPDLLPNDANFPPDLFDFVFGLARADWEIKKAEAEANGQLVSNCSSIASAGTSAGDNYPLWWVDGNCSFTGNNTMGSESNPIILVVEDAELSVTGNSNINGIVYVFDNPDDAATPSTALGGTTEINGSFISDVGGAAMSGSYSVVYNPNIINAFSPSDGSNYSFTYVPGSWKDF
jgi:hypothetical protein